MATDSNTQRAKENERLKGKKWDKGKKLFHYHSTVITDFIFSEIDSGHITSQRVYFMLHGLNTEYQIPNTSTTSFVWMCAAVVVVEQQQFKCVYLLSMVVKMICFTVQCSTR